MQRHQATRLCRDELDKYGLTDWGIRLTTDVNAGYLGLCSYKDKCIIMSAHHIETHPDPEVINTIKHEVAHCLTPGHRHDEVWAAKAKELGCTDTRPCSSLEFSPAVIDAIRSGATVEVSFEEETHTVYRPKYQITRLQDKCPVEKCGKVAVIKSELDIPNKDPFQPDEKWQFLECGHLIIKKIPKGTPFHLLKSTDEKTPYPFQSEGMRFIESALSMQKGAAVFDEMGLGKTVQALGYLNFHPEDWPVLFIVKQKIKFQWFKEILRWCGDARLCQIINGSNDFIIPNLRGYIISYDMLVHKTRKSKTGKTITQGFDVLRFKDIVKTVVLDECQQIKNPDASRTQEVRKIAKYTKVIALSGTPWKNRGSEFFTILNMLAPMKFPSYQKFLDNWVDTYFDGKYTRQGGIANPKRFKEYIKDIAIRREVADVEVQMPDVNRTLAFCELDDYNQSTYDDEVSEFVQWYNEKVIGGEEDDFSTGGNILAKLARMRHITGLAKIPATMERVEEFLEETDRKLVIFVHHKDVGQILMQQIKELIERECPNENIPVISMTADMNGMEAFQAQELFNNSKRAFAIASTLASGEGINLQTCADAIMHERQWNPQNEDQAAPGRFRRIGSAFKHVNVTFTTAAGTVDEILAEIVERKRGYFHTAMNKGEMPVWNQTSMAKEIAEGIVDAFNKKNKGKLTKAASL